MRFNTVMLAKTLGSVFFYQFYQKPTEDVTPLNKPAT